jgi:acyl-CoA synthetase (NDP forming)
MIASATPEQYTRTIEIVGTDPGIDAVVIYIPPLVTTPEEIAPAIAQGAGRMPAHKPVLSVFLSSRGAPPVLSAGPRGQLPSYRFPENAAQALAAAVHYGRWRARPRGIPVTLSPFAHSAVRAVIDRVLEGAVEPLWIQAANLVTVLRVVRIECAVAVKSYRNVL